MNSPDSGSHSSITSARRTREALGALALWLWIGFGYGLVEALILLVRREWLGQFVWAPGPIWWMTPAATVLALAPIAGAVAIAALLAPGRVSSRAQVFVFSLVAGGGLLLMIPAIHPAALLLLAAGLAGLMARSVDGGPRLLRTLMQPSSRMAGAVVAVWALGGLGLTAFSRPPPPVADANRERPSILLIILDTVRAGSMSLYGYEHPTTPHLSALADSSAVFERAIAPSSWTLPSHASMFTGRSAPMLNADWRVPMSGTPPTIAEVLAAAGYETAAFTANFMYTDAEKGLDRGFRIYDDHRLTWKQVALSGSLGQMLRVWGRAVGAGGGVRAVARRLWSTRPPPERWSDRKAAEHVNDEVLSWLEARSARPYFAFLNYFDAHRPYDAPDSTRRVVDSWGSENVAYDASLVHIDRSIRDLLDRMAKSGDLDNTIVIVTSDHGELFGEHGLRGHGNSLYYPLLHVPLLIHAPRLVPPRRVQATVSLADLPATVLDLAGLPAALAGRSLAGLWEEAVPSRSSWRPTTAVVRRADNVPDHHPVSRGDVRSIIAGGFHYILEASGHEELYRVSVDPGETTDLAGRREWRDKLVELRAAVASAFSPAAVAHYRR